MHTLPVPLPGREYDILIDSGVLARGECEALRAQVDGRKCFVICDATLNAEHAEHYPDRLGELLEASGAAAVDICALPIHEDGNEANKSMEAIAALCEAAIDAGLDRTSRIVALGGGVVGDMAGFLAAIFMRGIPFIQVPTTLVAQVDSSIGGKTGVNLPNGKNLVGAFHQPSLVLIDVDCLQTLPPRQLACGLAEVVKYGCIMDAPFFDWLDEHREGLLACDPEVYAYVIQRSCECKRDVVVVDEFDTTGRRAILNYGHTFGHSLEALAGYGTLTHGEGVSIGMAMACDLALMLDPTSVALLEMSRRQEDLLVALGLPTRAPAGLSPEDIAIGMRSDKKYEKGRNRLLLPFAMGDVRLVKDVDEDLILRAIAGRCS